jgi:hypothetical protein
LTLKITAIIEFRKVINHIVITVRSIQFIVTIYAEFISGGRITEIK